MSQNPTAKNPPRPRVASGVPWWLWAIMVIVGGGILTSLVTKLTPADPAKAFTEGFAAAESGDIEKLKECRAILGMFPEYESQRNLLDGMAAIGTGRPLYAIPLLEAASKSETLKQKAMQYLGMSFVQADERAKAIAVFESILKDDENAHAARNSLVMIFNEIFALEEALKHMTFLIEQEFKLSEMYNMRGETRMTLERYKDAADDFEASIEANATDPMNSVKSNKLVECLMIIGDFKRAEKFVDNVDQPMTRELLKAETSLANGDLETAATVLRGIPPEARNSPAITQLYGKVMLAQNEKGAAQEALFNLRNIIAVKTRDPKLFQVTGDLARFVGETELANLAQQNVDQLTDLNKEYVLKLQEVVKTRDDKDIRLQLADLAFKTDHLDIAYKLYEGLMRYYPDDAEKMSDLQLTLMEPLPQLVSTGTPPTTPPTEAAPTEAATPQTIPPETASPQTTPEAEKPQEPAESANAAPADPATVPASDAKASDPANPPAATPEKAVE